MSSNLAMKPAPTRVGNQPVKMLGRVRGAYPIFFHARVLDCILDYSAQDPYRECGGFLVGDVYRHSEGNGSSYVEVRQFAPARDTIGAAASMRFTHATWAGLSRDLETRFPGERVVGWHHTHPGLGIFLSAHDRFIHTHFFSSPWHVAMVVDPRNHEFAFFQWDQGRLIDVGFIWVPPPSGERMMESVGLLRSRSAVG